MGRIRFAVRRSFAPIPLALPAAAWLALNLAPVSGALGQPSEADGLRALEFPQRVERGKQRAIARSADPPAGPVYTWADGDRTRRVWLQEDLVLRKDGVAAPEGARLGRAGAGDVFRVASAASAGGQPVFRSASGALMTLPGGVVLVFAPEWGKAERDVFLAAHGIVADRVSPLGALPNGFLIETEPGFPSLELANALAGRDGVEISSPNWWREVETR